MEELKARKIAFDIFWPVIIKIYPFFQAMQSVDTGSQVCNLAWSKHSSELVSTHGYSQNQILVWKYPSLVQVTFWDRFIVYPHQLKQGQKINYTFWMARLRFHLNLLKIDLKIMSTKSMVFSPVIIWRAYMYISNIWWQYVYI